MSSSSQNIQTEKTERKKKKKTQTRFAVDVDVNIKHEPAAESVKTPVNLEKPHNKTQETDHDWQSNSDALPATQSSPKITEGLCENCYWCLSDAEVQSVFVKWVEPETWNVPAKTLQKNAEAGCPFCKIFLRIHGEKSSNAGAAFSNESHKRGPASINQKDASEDEEEISVPLTVFAKDPPELEDHCQMLVGDQLFDVFVDEGDPAAKVFTNRARRVDKASDESFLQIQAWMSQCVAGHGPEKGYCKQNLHTIAELPRRIIDVAAACDNQGETTAKLVELEAHRSKYVALSYCWGEEQWNPLTTTTANYETHCHEIPLDSASQTIQDAVTTTRRLGLRYLWVDALCIIQDSREDKDTQISQLRSVFENATLTLVAAHGANASVGLFGMPATQRVPEIGMKWTLRPGAPEGTVHLSRNRDPGMATQPINKRAWTLEERLLSHKKVFFLADRVAWECDGLSLLDSGDIVNSADDIREFRMLAPRTHEARLANDAFALEMLVHSLWTSRVQWYTARRLTKSRDKLRAIGGLAELQQQTCYTTLQNGPWKDPVLEARRLEILRGKYLAGLWSGLLQAGMLWRRVVKSRDDEDGWGGLQPRPNEYRAPSWSWASMEGEIEYSMPIRDEGSIERAVLGYGESIAVIMKLHVAEAAVDLVSSARPFGAVNGGFVEADGMVKAVQGTFEPIVHPDLGEAFTLNLPAPSGHSHVTFWPDSVQDLPIEGTAYWLLAMDGEADATRDRESNANRYSFYCRGPVLVEVLEGQYRRVGFFEHWDSDFDRLISTFSRQNVYII